MYSSDAAVKKTPESYNFSAFLKRQLTSTLFKFPFLLVHAVCRFKC